MSVPRFPVTSQIALQLGERVGLRIRLRLGPVEIADRLCMTSSTLHAVLALLPVEPTHPPRQDHQRTHPPPVNVTAPASCFTWTSRNSARSPTAEAFALSDTDKGWWPRPGAGPPSAPAAYRPQTSDKIERFRRTLAEGWALKKSYGRQKPAASQPCPDGSTPTITTGPTPRSEKPHPSPDRGLFTGGVSPVKLLVGADLRMNMNKLG